MDLARVSVARPGQKVSRRDATAHIEMKPFSRRNFVIPYILQTIP